MDTQQWTHNRHGHITDTPRHKEAHIDTHTDTYRHTHRRSETRRRLHTSTHTGTWARRDGPWAESVSQSHGRAPCLSSAVGGGGFSSPSGASCRESHHGRRFPLFPGACLSGSSVTSLERAHPVRPGPPGSSPLCRTEPHQGAGARHLHAGDCAEDGSGCSTIRFTSQGTSLVARRLGRHASTAGAQV